MEAIPYNELVLLVVILAQFVIAQLNKGRSEVREEKLLKAIISKSLPEYVDSLETPKDRIKHMNAESKLAGEATKLEREMAKTSGTMDQLPSGSYPIN